MRNDQANQFEVGDIVFIEVPFLTFKYVSEASLCWSNHVGLIVGHDGTDYIIAESTIPLSRKTTLSAFINRSVNQHYEVKRLKEGLTDQQKFTLISHVFDKLNIPYHTGFKLDSKRQFCSKFVFELYQEALSIELGRVETFSELLNTNPEANLMFWRFWFFGNIPWSRKTVTPASLYYSSKLEDIFVSDNNHKEENIGAQLEGRIVQNKNKNLSKLCVA